MMVDIMAPCPDLLGRCSSAGTQTRAGTRSEGAAKMPAPNTAPVVYARGIRSGIRSILALCCALLGSALFAQSFHGKILGTITDTSSAVISGAQVAARNVDTGLQ